MWNELLKEMLELVDEIFDSYMYMYDQFPFMLEVTTDVDPRTSTEDTVIPHVSLLGLDGIILEPVCRC